MCRMSAGNRSRDVESSEGESRRAQIPSKVCNCLHFRTKDAPLSIIKFTDNTQRFCPFSQCTTATIESLCQRAHFEHPTFTRGKTKDGVGTFQKLDPSKISVEYALFNSLLRRKIFSKKPSSTQTHVQCRRVGSIVVINFKLKYRGRQV